MCCGRPSVATDLPMTAGDIQDAGAGRPDRFAVVSKTETDDDGNAVVLSTHPDYALADLARKVTGGRIRVIRQ